MIGVGAWLAVGAHAGPLPTCAYNMPVLQVRPNYTRNPALLQQGVAPAAHERSILRCAPRPWRIGYSREPWAACFPALLASFAALWAKQSSRLDGRWALLACETSGTLLPCPPFEMPFESVCDGLHATSRPGGPSTNRYLTTPLSVHACRCSV